MLNQISGMLMVARVGNGEADLVQRRCPAQESFVLSFVQVPSVFRIFPYVQRGVLDADCMNLINAMSFLHLSDCIISNIGR